MDKKTIYYCADKVIRTEGKIIEKVGDGIIFTGKVIKVTGLEMQEFDSEKAVGHVKEHPAAKAVGSFLTKGFVLGAAIFAKAKEAMDNTNEASENNIK